MGILLWTVLCLRLADCLVLDSNGDVQLQLEQEKQARQRLETKVSEIEHMVYRLDSTVSAECVVHCPAQKAYAFMAQLSQTLTNPATGHVVVFDDVITNVGGAYNNVHGIFKVPVNGTYTFTLVASVPNDTAFQTMHLLLKLNTNTVGYIFFDGTLTYWLRRTTTIVLHMKQNDELWTEVAALQSNHALGGCCHHTHLSGFLVQAD